MNIYRREKRKKKRHTPGVVEIVASLKMILFSMIALPVQGLLKEVRGLHVSCFSRSAELPRSRHGLVVCNVARFQLGEVMKF